MQRWIPPPSVQSGTIQVVIRVSDLRREYGPVVALDGISFEIDRGEVVGFLGPNGAGKTTTMKILTGYLAPTAGRAWIAGLEVGGTRDPRPIVGYLPEHAPVYPELTVDEYLSFVSRVRALARDERQGQIEHALERCGLVPMRRRPLGALSKGYRQRVGLAQAILHDPEVLILDEPTTGLDPNQVVEIRSLVRELGETHTVIFSSHVMQEVQAVATRVIILHEGRVVADDTPDALTAGPPRVRLTVAGCDAASLTEALRAVPGITEVRPADPPHVTLTVVCGSDIRAALARAVTTRGWDLLELRHEGADLESVFRSLTAE